MKIFLTGGTGFVGSHFLEQALAAGHTIVCQRRSSDSRPRIPLSREPEWLDVPLDRIEKHHLEGADVLVHLAAHTPNVPYDTFERCHYWNVMAALRLLEKSLEANLRNWVVAGSCFEYGKSGERFDFIPTDAPLEPVGSYPTSKAAASVAIVGLANTHHANLFLGRIFQVYGEGEAEHRFWPSLRKAALCGGDFPMSAGEQVRDFIPVEDVARQFLEEASRFQPAQGPQNFSGVRIENIGTGNPTTLRDFAEHWWQKWNAKGRLIFGAVPYRPNEIMRFVPKVTRSSTS